MFIQCLINKFCLGIAVEIKKWCRYFADKRK